LWYIKIPSWKKFFHYESTKSRIPSQLVRSGHMALTIHEESQFSGSALRRGCVRQRNKKIKKRSNQDVRFELYLFESKKERKMMMIAFITMKSALVPLIEGLYSQISHLRYIRLSVVCVHIFCFYLSQEKICSRKKAVVSRFHPAS